MSACKCNVYTLINLYTAHILIYLIFLIVHSHRVLFRTDLENVVYFIEEILIGNFIKYQTAALGILISSIGYEKKISFMFF